jgi:hypothetical protein
MKYYRDNLNLNVKGKGVVFLKYSVAQNNKVEKDFKST